MEIQKQKILNVEEYPTGSIVEMNSRVKRIGSNLIIRLRNKLARLTGKGLYLIKRKVNMSMVLHQDQLLADELFGFVMAKNLRL